MRLMPLLRRLAALLLGLATAFGAVAGSLGSVFYVPTNFSIFNAYVVDWHAKSRAHIGANQGGGDGAWTDDGTTRVLTLDVPLSIITSNTDCNGNGFLQQVDTAQFAFRRLSGTDRQGATAVIELGTITDLGGCTPGLVTSFGALTDPGLATNHLAKNARPPITDLIPGAQLAGFTEGDFNLATTSTPPVAQITTFGPGTLTFEGTRDVYAQAVVDGWVQFTLPGGIDRRYTRITKDRTTGVETWIAADFVGGQTANLWQTLVTQPNTKAGFGTVKQSAHVWTSGLFLGTLSGAEYDLYTDFTGQRVLGNGDGTFTIQPITWNPDGANLVTTRVVGTTQRVRTWVPIANVHKNHFVFEEETWYLADGTTFLFIPPRVNYYVDGGVAVKPAAMPSAASTSASDAASHHPTSRTPSATMPSL